MPRTYAGKYAPFLLSGIAGTIADYVVAERNQCADEDLAYKAANLEVAARTEAQSLYDQWRALRR